MLPTRQPLDIGANQKISEGNKGKASSQSQGATTRIEATLSQTPLAFHIQPPRPMRSRTNKGESQEVGVDSPGI